MRLILALEISIVLTDVPLVFIKQSEPEFPEFINLALNKIMFCTKYIDLILIITITGFTAHTQNLKDSDVPGEVKEKITSMYPNVKGVTWEKEDDMFEAEVVENKMKTSVLFDAKGNFIQKEVQIQTSSFPPGVMNYVAKNLAKQKIEEAEKITDAGGAITYKAEVAGADYIFDSKGNFIRKEVEDDSYDDDE